MSALEKQRLRGRVVAIVQARMTSTRLPGKVVAEIAGRPSLALLLERLGRAEEVDAIAVATSTDPSDDPVAVVTQAADVPVFRGPLDDVLERYRLTAEALVCDGVVRVTADCPLIEPAVVDLVVRRWRHGSEGYVANCLEPRTYPKGLDTEVISWPALAQAAAEATEPADREHVTPFIRARAERFGHARVELNPSASNVRLVLDTSEDLEFLRQLVAAVGAQAGLDEILRALRTGRLTARTATT